MSFSLVTAPAENLLTLAEAKRFLRVTHTDSDNDAEITAMVGAATAWLDGPNGVTGRALVTQTWNYHQNKPREREVYVPLSPATTLVEIGYIDEDGQAQTFDTANVDFIKLADDTIIRLKDGQQWPNMQDRPDALRLQITFGYGDAAAVPDPVIAAAKLMVAHFYDNRHAVSDRSNLQEMPLGVRHLVDTVRARFAGA